MRAKSAKGKIFINAERCKEVATAACLLFCAVTFLIFAVKKDFSKAGMAVLSVVYVMIPFAVERIFRFRIQAPLYFVIAFYTICPLLGYSYKLYYILSWWDDMQHAFAGLVFAMFGAYLPRAFEKNGAYNVAFCAAFALVFSIAVAAVWEFMEFGADCLLGTDMQKDVLVDGRSSYLLGKLLGLPMDQTANVGGGSVVGGVAIDGYLDIGLIDTMCDMLIVTVGARVDVVIYAIGIGKVFVFVPHKKKAELVQPRFEDEAVEGMETAMAQTNEVLLQTENE